MAANKTSLSAGAIIAEILNGSTEVTARCNKIFPIVVDKAELPYILYRRTSMEQNPQKAGQPGADTVTIEVLGFTRYYDEGVELAEAVRGALDNMQATSDDGTLTMRSCTLIDSEEAWQDDAYIQQLVFSIKI